MIRIKQPAVALHSFDVPGYKYKMQFTENLPPNTVVQHIVGKILRYAGNTEKNYLENVVINCHGSPGQLHIGNGTTINSQNLSAMRLLNFNGQKVGTIWIVACQVAGYRRSFVKLGAAFCSALAQAAGCNVISADQVQYVNPGFYLRFCPKNHIDDYEGVAYRWDSAGNMQEFKRKDLLKG